MEIPLPRSLNLHELPRIASIHGSENQDKLTNEVMHPVSYTWRDAGTKGNLFGLSDVSVVIWQP